VTGASNCHLPQQKQHDLCQRSGCALLPAIVLSQNVKMRQGQAQCGKLCSSKGVCTWHELLMQDVAGTKLKLTISSGAATVAACMTPDMANS